MSEVFEGYESRFSKLSADLFRKTSSAVIVDGDKKRPEIRKMDVEARSLQANVKAVLLAKVREYQSDLNNLKNEVKLIASTSLEKDARDELLEAGILDVSTASASEAKGDRIITTLSNTSSDRVEEGKDIMLEGQELGVPLLQNLHQQQQTDAGAKGNMIHRAWDETSTTDRAVDSIPRRICHSKWAIGGILAVLVLTFCIILYFRF